MCLTGCVHSDEVTKSYAGTSQRSAEKTGQPSSSSLVSLVLPPQRTLVGSYGDILDLRVLASQYISDAVSPAFQLAVVSNSAIVRVVDDHQHCALLQGHSDIVLSVDSSPDGYVSLLSHFSSLFNSSRVLQDIEAEQLQQNELPLVKFLAIAYASVKRRGEWVCLSLLCTIRPLSLALPLLSLSPLCLFLSLRDG